MSQMFQALDKLSIDVWQNIFEFACTDGGRTGAILSRVSKTFRLVSARSRFQSVELYSLKRVERFLTCYEAAVSAAEESKADVPYVHHLLLSFLPHKADIIVLEGSYHFRDFHSWQQCKIGWNERFVTLMTKVFTLISPRLETMTVLQRSDVMLPYVHATFPALLELTLLEEDRMFLRASRSSDSWMEPSDNAFYSAPPPPTKDELAASPIFPALQELHLVEGSWKATLPLWSVAAPRLSDLRLSSTHQDTYQALGDLLRSKTNEFASLRRVTILPEPVTKEHADDTVAVDELRQSRVSLDFSVLPTLKFLNRNPKDWCDTLTRAWVSRAGANGSSWDRDALSTAD